MDVVQSESPYYSSSPSPTSSSPPHSLLGAVMSSQKRRSGRKKFKETRHPVYKGIRQRNGNKWVCEVREPNKKSRIWAGTYPTAEMAARAHDVAVLALMGTSAMFNFPDTISLLPVAKSCSAADIREAASKVSEVFGGPTLISSTGNSSSSKMELHEPCLVEGKRQGTVKGGDEVFMTERSNNNDDDEEENKSVFFDEEAIYNMPGLLDSMAEGLLMTPPSMMRAFDWDDDDSELIDLTLWRD